MIANIYRLWPANVAKLAPEFQAGDTAPLPDPVSALQDTTVPV